MAHLQKVSGRPQTARCWEMRRFSRSILVSPMRSSAEKRSQSITVTVSVWSYTAAVERECFMYSHKVRGSIITHIHNTYSRSTIINESPNAAMLLLIAIHFWPANYAIITIMTRTNPMYVYSICTCSSVQYIYRHLRLVG